MGVVADLKAFLTQSTFITLAVAFVVGVQVSAVVTALVTSVINPAVGAVFQANFAQIGLFTVRGSTFTFGTLLGAVLTFVIVLLVLFFLIVYPYGKYQERVKARAAAAPPTTKSCPFCISTIDIKATRCAFCTAEIPTGPAPRAPGPAAH